MRSLAEELSCRYLESSALNGDGVDLITNRIFTSQPSLVTKKGHALSQMVN